MFDRFDKLDRQDKTRQDKTRHEDREEEKELDGQMTARREDVGMYVGM